MVTKPQTVMLYTSHLSFFGIIYVTLTMWREQHVCVRWQTTFTHDPFEAFCSNLWTNTILVFLKGLCWAWGEDLLLFVWIQVFTLKSKVLTILKIQRSLHINGMSMKVRYVTWLLSCSSVQTQKTASEDTPLGAISNLWTFKESSCFREWQNQQLFSLFNVFLCLMIVHAALRT